MAWFDPNFLLQQLSLSHLVCSTSDYPFCEELFQNWPNLWKYYIAPGRWLPCYVYRLTMSLIFGCHCWKTVWRDSCLVTLLKSLHKLGKTSACFLLGQEISACDKRFLPVVKNVLHGQEICSFDKILLFLLRE